MPERQRGRDPDRQRHKEERQQPNPLPEYYRAAKFPDEPTSNTAYEGVHDALKETPCDLSTYRTILLPTNEWHVLVLGQPPEEPLRERIDQTLLRGTAVELPEEVWRAFNERRLEQTVQGPWVEKRHLRRFRQG